MMLEPFNFKGFKIVNQQKMKQSGCKRITVELTVQDSKLYAGSLGIAEAHDLCFDGTWIPTEIEGEDHVDSMRVKTLVGKNSLYVRFKQLCEEYSGDNFYQDFKNKHGIKHLRELENKMPIEEVQKMLNDEMDRITSIMLGDSSPSVTSVDM